MPEFLHVYHFANYIIAICISAIITAITIPSILHVARSRHLYDDLGHFRKQHDHGIPRLGGVGIFVSFSITILLFSMLENSFYMSYLLIASIIIFATGLKDDLSGVNSSTKFMVQFVVSLILSVLGNVRITSMYGMFGVFELPYVFSIMLTVLVMLLIINAFNLIDGIDGLAATTGILANFSFSILFIVMHQYELTIVSLAIVGAIIGFLRFNLTPAKIFMGDTGSLLIGLISVVLAIKLIELNKYSVGGKIPLFYCMPAIVVAILIGPIFDTVRVFVLRIANGVSPFVADRNHIHHRFLKLGLTHLQTTLILAAFNLLAIFVVLLLSNYSNLALITLIFIFCLVFNWSVTFLIRSKERHSLALRNLFL